MKRLLTFVLVLSLIFGQIPAAAFAAESDHPLLYTSGIDSYPVMEADTETTVKITTGGKWVYYRFTPRFSESYTFYSLGDSDTYGYLYDESMKCLASSDDDGEGMNFSITYALTAGEDYVFAARYTSRIKIGSFPVMLQTNHEAEGVVTVPATCTTDGEMRYTCFVCGSVYTEAIPASHTWSEDKTCVFCGEDWYISGSCGHNVTWTLTRNGTLTISGSGPMTDFPESGAVPWYDNRSSITGVIIENGVTTIGDHAFYELDRMSSVTIGSSVTTIGYYAFYDCTSLSSVTIPDGVITIGSSAFADCDSLGSVTIPDSVTDFGWRAFSSCDNLRSVTIGSGVTAVGNSTFIGCVSLTSVTLPDSVTTIESSAFYECDSLMSITIPEGVTTIESSAFYGCDSLHSVTIPDSVTTIDTHAFENCTGLSSVTIGSGLTDIGDNAFESCYELTGFHVDEDNRFYSSDGAGVLFNKQQTELIQVPGAIRGHYSIPDSVITIDVDAFYGCDSLSSVTIGKSITMIDYCGLKDCSSLTAIYVDEDNPVYSSDSAGVLFDKMQTELILMPIAITGHYTLPDGVTTIGAYTIRFCDSLSSIAIPDSVTAIGDGAFYACDSLTSVTMGSGMTIIGDSVFYECDALRSVKIPDSVTTIGDYAFYGCDSLSSATIGSGVTSIGKGVFFFCLGLEEIMFRGDAPSIGTNAFVYVNATVYYPADNETWTEDVMQNYGSNLTWVPCSVVTEVASGWSGETTWKLYDDGRLVVTGPGKMKNYGYGGGQPWVNKGVDITSVVIEDGVTSVGSGAFRNLTTLKTVSLPESLTKMGEAAFYGSGLESVEIPASLWTIQPYTFKNCTNLKSVKFNEGNLLKISDGAFYGTGLTELVLPDCLDILDIFAFKGCADLTSITIGSGLTELREAVFYGTAIPSITIPEGITKIGPYAFKNCVELETVDMPESLTSVGEASFYACSALASLELPDQVTAIGDYAFRKCASLTDVSFGSGLTTIGESSFYGCEGITSLTIPRGVTHIKGYAFKGCTALMDVMLSRALTTLGESAFHSCTSLTELSVPAKVTIIGAYCFSGSSGIRTIEFLGNAPAIGVGAFNKITATAWYPEGNTTWTTAKMQNYGGTITWKAN